MAFSRAAMTLVGGAAVLTLAVGCGGSAPGGVTGGGDANGGGGGCINGVGCIGTG